MGSNWRRYTVSKLDSRDGALRSEKLLPVATVMTNPSCAVLCCVFVCGSCTCIYCFALLEEACVYTEPGPHEPARGSLMRSERYCTLNSSTWVELLGALLLERSRARYPMAAVSCGSMPSLSPLLVAGTLS